MTQDLTDTPDSQTPAEPTDHPAGPRNAPDTPAGGYHVWHYNEKVYHYRVPIWDGLVEAGQGLYTLKVIGETDHGQAFGGGDRDYIETDPVHRSRLNTHWVNAEQAIRQHKPDVVIINSNPRFRSSWSIPKLVHSYGGVTISWTKSHSYSKLPDPLLNLIKNRLMKRYDLIIAYGKQTREEMLGLGVRDDQVFIAQNTVDTRPIFEREDEYRAMGEKLREDHNLVGKKILLDLGRMDSQKRHEDLFTAWPKLRELDPDLVLVMVGGGPSLDDYRRMAKETDPDRILITGRVPIGHDYAWIAAADIAIQCGAVGLAINQCMAFGTPTVIADQIGVDTELIEHGITGWRFKEGDIDAIVHAVKHVMSADEERERVLARAKTVVRDEANLDNMVNQIDACLRAAFMLREDRKNKR